MDDIITPVRPDRSRKSYRLPTNARAIKVKRDRRLAKRFKTVHRWSHEQLLMDERIEYDRLIAHLIREGVVLSLSIRSDGGNA